MSDGAHHPLQGSDDQTARTGVVIVNWNGWADTLEALESVLRMERFTGPVVVVDNGSTDGSVELIMAWARGELCILPQCGDSRVRELVIPPVLKPLTVQRLAARDPGAVRQNTAAGALFVVCSESNLGFAGGNNLGLRLLMSLSGIEFFWLINNDAVPCRDAYTELMSALTGHTGPLVAGSALLEYFQPDVIQAAGARFSRLLGSCRHLLAGESAADLLRLESCYAVDYPIGAGMVLNRAFIDRHGYLSEDYFIYYEEIDCVLRMGWPSRSFVVPRSRVFHKGSASTQGGTMQDVAKRSLAADYYMIRGRLLLARKISWWALLSVSMVTLVAIVRRIFRAKRGLLKNALRASWHGVIGVKGTPAA